MKKTLLLTILFLTLGFQLSAQEMPNGGFENWVENWSENWTVDSFLVEEPESWTTSNLWHDSSVLKTTDSHSGNFAVELVTPNVTIIVGPWSCGPELITTMLYSGYFANSAEALSFYVKCDSLPTYGRIEMYINGKSLNSSSSLIGLWYTDTIISDYTLIEIPFDQDKAHDSINISIYSSVIADSLGKPYGYASLKLDDMSLGGGKKDENGFIIYPNPTTNKLEVSSKENIISIELIDLQGRQVLIENINSLNYTIYVSRLQN